MSQIRSEGNGKGKLERLELGSVEGNRSDAAVDGIKTEVLLIVNCSPIGRFLSDEPIFNSSPEEQYKWLMAKCSELQLTKRKNSVY